MPYRELFEVIGGDLEAIDENLRAARVDAVGGEGKDDFRKSDTDGVSIFKLRQMMREGGGLTGALGRALPIALVVMEEAEVLFAQRGRFAFLSVGEDMTAFDVHDGSCSPPGGTFL